MKVYAILFKYKEEQFMNGFIDQLSDLVKNGLTGFDRIVFKGFILPLIPASEVMHFCRTGNILNNNYKNWMLAQIRKIIVSAEQYAKSIVFIKWPFWVSKSSDSKRT
jgi:hypothetical protein